MHIQHTLIYLLDLIGDNRTIYNIGYLWTPYMSYIMLRPFVPSVCFAVETSAAAVSQGFTRAAFEALERILQVGRVIETNL